MENLNNIIIVQPVYVYKNGNRYKGDWKNGKREGKGIAYLNPGLIFKGFFRNDKTEGIGKVYYNEGDVMEAELKNGKLKGRVRFYYDKGNKFRVFGKIEGKRKRSL